MALADPVPEPIDEAAKRDIFARYEQSLLKPVGRCQEWETVDARVKRVVSDAAAHFGGVAHLSSCYRSRTYNAGVYRRMGRKPTNSAHIRRKALDFVIVVQGRRVNMDALASWVRKHPIMRKIGGVGRYRSGIVHADVEKYRNWDWRRKARRYARGAKRWATGGSRLPSG